MKTGFLEWMTKNTQSMWNNDSADPIDIKDALDCGAVGVTTNPPLTYSVLTQHSDIYRDKIDSLDQSLNGDARNLALIKIVVTGIADQIHGQYLKSSKINGYVRAQVKPADSADKHAMLSMGMEFASWRENIKVKIPGTAAGIWVLEELAARGIPTNPTVCVSVSQIIEAAKANERGRIRAIEAGLQPADSTAAFVMGRLQDFLIVQNKEQNIGLRISDIENAMIALTKKIYWLMIENRWNQRLMPAAFRSAKQVSELAGAKVEMTIHPKIQALLNEAEIKGEIERSIAIENPIEEASVQRVLDGIPEFRKAYYADELSVDEFDQFGATTMTLKGFDEGWKKLSSL